MDFNDYRLFVIPDALPSARTPIMQGKSRPEPSLELDLSLTLTEDDHQSASVSDVTDDWAHVNISQSGEVDTLSPALTPTEDSDRMARSLDLGHGSYEDDIDNYSFPWQGKSRTLDNSPHRILPQSTSQTSTSNGVQRQASSGSDSDKIKYKIMSAWNNMKFELKPKSTFKPDSPIWYLGICYHFTKEEDAMKLNGNQGGNAVNMALENFKRDFVSRIWFTYRKDFPKLYGSQLTTDVGWGCMLRTGQMLLAQGLVMHFLGRDWRWHSHQRKYDSVFHHQIIKFFGDLSSDECPFAIHKLVQFGVNSGRKPGDWYGPASVAHVLKEAVDHAPELNALLHQVCLYIAQDCTVYKQDVIDICTRSCHVGNGTERRHSKSSSQSTDEVPIIEEPWRAVIILIPVRLGGESFNPIYIPCLRSLLAHDNCLGIIGGRPKHSLYFIGWQDDKLIHLDPHLCQDFVDVRDRNFPMQTFHCMSPRKMAFTKMDPSCTLGFYCRTRAEFIKVVREAEQMAAPPKEKGLYPMFVFQEGRSRDLMATEPGQAAEERYMRVRRLDRKGRPKGTPKEADDFVLL